MQVIASLLKLQSHAVEEQEVKDILNESQNRVYAMSAVHEILHGSENLAEIDLKVYLSKITNTIFQSFLVSQTRIKLLKDIEDILISINQASPLGLIVNELVSNSLKHAFPEERKGIITISVKCFDNQFELLFKDNGIGIPDGFDWKNSGTLGLKLVRTLTENQLDGTIEMESKNGISFIIKFNLET